MKHLEHIFQIWNKLYDKDLDATSIIEQYFHNDYTQCINGTVMNRSEYIDHVKEQKKNIQLMEFKCKNYLLQSNELFIIYDAIGKNIQGDDIKAEVISYFEFKDKKVLKIHGQVHLLEGNPSDIDMND